MVHPFPFPFPLAYADATDSSSSNQIMVLGGAVILAVTAGLTALVIFLARARRHRRADLITTAAIFWALITAGSLLHAGSAQMSWSKEYTIRLESGYLDPSDTTDAPKLPWMLWAGLGVGYAGLLGWSFSGKRDGALSKP